MPFPYSFPASEDISAGAYARQLKALLPPGRLWLLENDSVLSEAMLALGGELQRVSERGIALIEESDPRTATETLADWERMLGLPDECVTAIPATPAARRLAITQKMIKQGGQTPAYYIALAAACGYTATIDETYGQLVLRSGFLCGSRCYEEDWAHVWRMDISDTAPTALTNAELECIISRVAPAHTIVLFNYL
jgi:uncharacterized protein YmfQ (DUF2313 family)